MKKELSTLIMLFIGTCVYAQTINYNYDNAGNRLRRYVDGEVIVQSAAVASEEIEEPMIDVWEEREVSIYPNPTEGELKVSITGGELEEVYTYRLYNSAGTQILNGQIDQLGETILSLSNQSTGIYVLVLTCNSESKTYKIIKQ
jgi:hypothetical protein